MKIKILVLLMATFLCVCSIPFSAFADTSSYELRNPRIAPTQNTAGVSDLKCTWDCVYFGSYPQNDIEGVEKEPIKWRVLSVDGNDAFLLADQILDTKQYHNVNHEDVTWATCSLRTWLNGDFYNKAFNSSEQEAIKTTTVVNAPNLGTNGGVNTQDKVYLLSISEVMNENYGFPNRWDSFSETLEAKNTDFVKEKGAYNSYYNNGYWWLRSPGVYANAASYVSYSSIVEAGGDAVCEGFGVRPALHIDLSSSVWTYAGRVCSDGTDNEVVDDFPIDKNKDVWNFKNPDPGGLTYKIYQDMFDGDDLAWLIWQKGGTGEGGICYGMAQTVLASYLGYPDVKAYEYDEAQSHRATYLNQVKRGAYNYDLKTSAIDLIRHAFVYQYSLNANISTSKKDDLDGLYEAAISFQNNGKQPVAINLSWGILCFKDYHALAVIGVEKCENGYNIKLYDCNLPGEDVFITLFGSPGNFTSWAEYWKTDKGLKESHYLGDDLNSHIQYLSVTRDLIEKFEKIYGKPSKSSSFTRSSSDGDGMIIALDASSQGELNYNGETVRIEEIYDSELNNIFPVLESSDIEASYRSRILCWLVGDDKKVTVNDIAENNEVSVAGSGAVITAKTSNASNISIDASDNSVSIDGQDGTEFTASYEYVGEDKVSTFEVTGVIDSTVEIIPESDGLNVTGASDVQTTETATELPGEDDPCANGHSWNIEYTIDEPSSCTSVGSESIHCSVCGLIKEGSVREIPKTSHTYGTWKTAKAATELAAGKKSRTCSVCGKTETKTIAKLKPTLPAVTIVKPVAAKKAATIKWKKVSAKNQKKIAKIQIQYSTDKNFKKGVKTVYAKKSATSKKITKLTSKKTYYVRIRAYKSSGGVVHVSKWSKTRNVKAK